MRSKSEPGSDPALGNGHMEPHTWAAAVAAWRSSLGSLFSRPAPKVDPSLFTAPTKSVNLFADSSAEFMRKVTGESQ
jgi:hypothetical protein